DVAVVGELVDPRRQRSQRDVPVVVAVEHVGQRGTSMLTGLYGDDFVDVAASTHRAVSITHVLTSDVHDQVDVLGDLPVGERLADVRAGLHRTRDQPLDGRARRVRVGGRQRPGAGLHRLEHGQNLFAADLADDHAIEVVPQGVEHEIVQGDLAGHTAAGVAFTAARAGLPGDDALVPVGHVLQVQLVLGLDGAE